MLTLQEREPAYHIGSCPISRYLMDSKPEHIYTFFFSDIERSTRLAQQLGAAYGPLLERHRRVIRKIMRHHAGRLIDTAGDGFFIIFPDPDAAVLAAVSIQQHFFSQPWARSVGLKVRIGIHCGEATATTSGYTGLEVHRASRVCEAAHGGQIMLSQATVSAVQKQLPDNMSCRDLGSYQLKDFNHPERLYQLVVPGLPADFPPPRLGSSQIRVAVMPFDNLSKDPEQEYFCDGVAEEIILALGSIPGLRVAARASSFALKGERLSAMEKGQRLNATAILEGTVRQKNSHLRISVELVDAATGMNIWSERYDRMMEDVFAVQDEIARNITRSLEVKLIPEQRQAIQDRQTSNVEAYDFYLKGRRFYYQFSRSSVSLALEMFRKAIEIDGSYALAWCGKADCHAYLYMYVERIKKHLEEAAYSSNRAIALAPLLAEAHAARGLALSLQEKLEEAEASFDKAVELNPHLFEAWYQYARMCFAFGKMDKAARLFEEASRARPEDYQALLLAAQVYEKLDIPELARRVRERGIAIAEKHLLLNPGDTRALYMGANGLAGLGKREKALAWLQRALTLEPDDPMLLYNAGCIYALLHMEDEAITCLERSYTYGLTQRGWFEHDSNLDPLRNKPRFKALLAKTK